MSSNQIVFLFDLNAFRHDNSKSDLELDHKLQCLRFACLRILTYYSSLTSDLRWGFKFFDSQGALTQTMCKYSFSNLSLESVESLENEISIRYPRHKAYIEALSESAKRDITPEQKDTIILDKECTSAHPIQILHLALTQILCEYQFDDFSVFSPLKQRRTLKHSKKKNFLFLVSECPGDENRFVKYFGSVFTSMDLNKFKKLLLTSSLQHQLLQKSSVSWIWLNSSDNSSFLDSLKPNVLGLISETMKFWQCALFPLSIFSTPSHIIKFQNDRAPTLNNIAGDCNSSFIPFSTSFIQSFSHSFYSQKAIVSEIKLCFSHHPLEICMTLSRIGFEAIRTENKSSHPIPYSHEMNTFSWSKCTVHFAIPKTMLVPSNEMYLCLPDAQKRHIFQNVMKFLFINELNLFIVCEGGSSTTHAILSPLTDTFAVISAISTKQGVTNESFSLCGFQEAQNTSALKIKTEGYITNLKSEIKDMTTKMGNHNFISKPFQMESTEVWFEPTSAVSTFITTKCENQNCGDNIKKFLEKIRSSSKLCKKPMENKLLTPSNSQEIPVNTDLNLDEPIKILNNEPEDLEDDVSYDKLIEMLTETYDMALNSNASVFYSGKKIVKFSSSFFFKKSIVSHKDNMNSFMAEYFTSNIRTLNEKFNNIQDPYSKEKKIKECQLQAILTLEMEILFPSMDRSNCVNPVVSFLRLMSCYSGASELNKFLCEDLKDNYSSTLYDILVEVGDELDICLVPDEEDLSPDDHSEAASEVMFEMPSSVKSNLSVKSSSSTSSRSDGRKLVRRRSDISDSHKSRQVLMPVTSPKRKRKSHGAIKIPIRYSPRLASKKKRERLKVQESNPENVRRNLFPRDQKPQTPRGSKFSPYGKKRTNTPKSHHVLKTQFVAETPSHKQNLSALQRRKSFIEEQSSETSFTEVAESPSVSNIKDSAHLKALQRLKEKRQLSENDRPSSSGAKTLPSYSQNSQYTPESKRRLSLKLFSKYLTSPTARMGLKKCSKRLFDPVSPRSRPSAKKPRIADCNESNWKENPDG